MNIGSEWHRWDVHIHTPGTALEDKYDKCTLDQFIHIVDEKSKEKDVIALGITDYYSITNYIEIKKKLDSGKFKNIKLLFPNIEFRLGIPSKNSKGINIHLLISPDDPEHIYKINNNLQRLIYNYHGTPYSCTKEQIIRLGSILDPKIIDENKKYERGLINFRPEFREFINWFDGDSWLKENALIAISGNSSDGISALSPEGGFAALRNEINNRVHIIFTSNPKDIKYYSGEKIKETVEINKHVKPCLCGSDAHSIENILESKEKRYCWIKAEPNFEGLKQILYEPIERVFIGDIPPDINRKNYLSKIHVPDTDWFPNINIPINKGLVSIIGPRGSGKTALLDIISVGLNAYESGDAGFIAKAQKHVLPLKVYAEMNNLGRMRIVNFNNVHTNEMPNARYLSQQFVEKLCSTEGASTRLVEEIEKFIFNELDDYKKDGANNFSELKNSIVSYNDSEIEQLNGEIQECSNEITRISNLRNSLKSKIDEIAKLNNEIQSIKMPAKKEGEKIEIISKQEKYNDKYQSLNSKLIEIKGKGEILIKAKQKIEKYNQELIEKSNNLIEELSPINLTKDEKELFYISFHKNVFDILDKKINTLRNEHFIISGDKDIPKEGTYYWYKKELEIIKSGLENLSKAEKEYMELNKSIQDKKLKIINLEKQIEDINKLNIENYQKRRIEKYKKVFEQIEHKCSALSELYGPLENNLKTKYDEIIPLSLYVKRAVDIKAWVDFGEKTIISYTHNTKLKADGRLGVVADKILFEPWKTGTSQEICDAMNFFIENYISHDIKKLLRENTTPNDLAQWLFSTNHISTPYEIKYEGISIEKLSPGTRGVVLMLLFLKVDINDNRPLLIDQPEDNLDPASVYDILVPYFKEAKKRRQIIIVTHNPNLVVGTDSDQIIIANSINTSASKLPEFNYISGGLENSEIREKVCKILEGGEIAFNKRSERYFNSTK
ncbi:MAG: AAA family ATPase [Treponema sp.]|jgi:ABC-type lipoprotein export system ATPase subunit|nr:AAA family ATPase [Treponema sp.]